MSGPSRVVRSSATAAWLLILSVLLALILIPFFLWEGALVEATRRLTSGPAAGPALAAALTGLLVGDVVLPVPSSVVSTAAGVRFGLLGGILVSTAGLTGGCLLGYGLGRRLGEPAVARIAGRDALSRVRRAAEGVGDWVLVLCRAVPVLAEASVLLGGLGRMPLGRFLLLTGLSNLGLSAAYAWVGSRSADAGSFLLAFGGAVIIPALAVAGWRVVVPSGDPAAGGVAARERAP